MQLHHSPTPNPTHAYPHLLVCFSVIQPQTTNNRTHHSCHHQCQANSPSVHFFSLSTNIYMVLINNLLPLRVKFRPLGSLKCKTNIPMTPIAAWYKKLYRCIKETKRLSTRSTYKTYITSANVQWKR